MAHVIDPRDPHDSAHSTFLLHLSKYIKYNINKTYDKFTNLLLLLPFALNVNNIFYYRYFENIISSVLNRVDFLCLEKVLLILYFIYFEK